MDWIISPDADVNANSNIYSHAQSNSRRHTNILAQHGFKKGGGADTHANRDSGLAIPLVEFLPTDGFVRLHFSVEIKLNGECGKLTIYEKDEN